MSERTPTPWRLGAAGDTGYSNETAPCHIWTDRGPGWGLIATTAPWCQPSDQQRADAAFIVKACNAHDELVKALEKIIEMNRQHAKDQYGDADKAESWACITVARKALASIEVPS